MKTSISHELMQQITQKQSKFYGDKLLMLLFSKASNNVWELDPIRVNPKEWAELNNNKKSSLEGFLKGLEEIQEIEFIRNDGKKYKAVKSLKMANKDYFVELDEELAEHVIKTRIIFQKLIKFEEKQMQES